jgi:hypothetical protein
MECWDSSMKISGFRRDVNEIFFWNFTQRRMVIPYRRFGTTYRSHLRVSSSLSSDCLTLEDGTDTFSRNICTELPFCAA